MEFVRGKTLADIVRGGRLSAAEAVLIGEDLCRALSAVHRAGFIHRDVKAKNVMRDETAGSS
jgi:serine/threonine protein kinase